MHLVLNKLGECGGCRYLVIGPDGAGEHSADSPCGNCERNPKLLTFLRDNKARQEKVPDVEIPEVPPTEGLPALTAGNAAIAKEWGITPRSETRPRRR